MANSLKPAWLIRADATYRGGTVELADGHQTPAQQVQGGARTINSVPEVKWEPRHQRLNGNSVPEFKWEKNGHQSCLPVRVFAIFFDVSRCKRCSAMSRNMYIFYPGDSHIKGTGMLVGNFEKPLKKTNLGVGQPFFFFTPERHHIVTMFFRYWCYRKLWLHELSK